MERGEERHSPLRTRCLPCVAVRPWPRHLNAPPIPRPSAPRRPPPAADSRGFLRPSPARRVPRTRRELPAPSGVSAPRRGRRAPREARVQRLENERCREGGPELQVTRASPRPERAPHPLPFPTWRPAAPAGGLRAGPARGVPGVGARDVGGSGRPGWRGALTLFVCRAAPFALLFPGAAGGGGCGERGRARTPDASEDGEVSADRASLSGHRPGPRRGAGG